MILSKSKSEMHVCWFGRKWPPKRGVLQGGMALLEEMCHCGSGFGDLFFSSFPLYGTVSQLPVACKMYNCKLQHHVSLHAALLPFMTIMH